VERSDERNEYTTKLSARNEGVKRKRFIGADFLFEANLKKKIAV